MATNGLLLVSEFDKHTQWQKQVYISLSPTNIFSPPKKAHPGNHRSRVTGIKASQSPQITNSIDETWYSFY